MPLARCQNVSMNARNFWIPLGLAGLLYLSFRAFGWWGFSLVSSGIIFWLLQHTSRLMRTMERAAQQPLGVVGSAVMLNSQLHPGMRLLQVIGLSGSLGKQTSPSAQQTEVFTWHDASGDSVSCTFQDGRLTDWALTRQA